MEIQLLALALLIIRLAGVYYLLKVVKVQNNLLRYPAVDERGVVDPDVQQFRKTLHRMTLVVLWGQFLPIVVDLVGTINPFAIPFWLSVLYSTSNCVTALTAAVLIWRLYKMADNVKEVNDLERAHVQDRHDEEMTSRE